MNRLRLHDVKLSGVRLSVRQVAFAVISVAAIVAAVGYLLPAHRLRTEDTFHSTYADGGPLPLILLAAAAVIVFLLRRPRFGAGIAAGFFGGALSFTAAGLVVLEHVFEKGMERAWGDDVFAAGILATLASSVLLVIADPIVYLLERRQLELAARPAPLPVAIASGARPTS